MLNVKKQYNTRIVKTKGNESARQFNCRNKENCPLD